MLAPIQVGPADALVIVDATKAFGPKGGLPVKGALGIVPVVLNVSSLFAPAQTVEVFDNHPPYHGGFHTLYVGYDEPNVTFLTADMVRAWETTRLAPEAEFVPVILIDYLEHHRDGGQWLWSVHAVQGTFETERFDALASIEVALRLPKGNHWLYDSYSGARDAVGNSTGLIEWLREHGFTRVFLVGLAFDFCVGWTAVDLAEAGFEVYLVVDGTRSVGIVTEEVDTNRLMTERLTRAGVRLVTSDQIRAAA